MIAMKFTIELEIGLSFLLQAALPQLVTDREKKLIVVGSPSDGTAIADAALRSRKRNHNRTLPILAIIGQRPGTSLTCEVSDTWYG